MTLLKKTILVLFLVLHAGVWAQSVQTIWDTDPIVAKRRPELQVLLEKQGSALGKNVYFRVFKRDASRFGVLEVWCQGRETAEYVLAKSFPICYYSGTLGPKTRVGDGQTPEGFYYITPQALNRFSSYHRAFNIGYPNEYDRALKRTGSLIMIHGNCVSIGCIAMGDDAIEQIWTMGVAALHDGQKRIPVHIFPFRLTDDNLVTITDTAHLSFWNMLKPAYIQFEKTRMVPTVRLVAGKYILCSR